MSGFAAMISSLTICTSPRLGDRTDTVTEAKKVLPSTTFIRRHVESGLFDATECLECFRGEHVFFSDIAGLPNYVFKVVWDRSFVSIFGVDR